MNTAIVIGSGIGGLAMGIRLQSLGFSTTIVEKHNQAGGRAMVLRQDGFVFDMGPTVITVPHFIEELFSLERGDPQLNLPDYPKSVLETPRPTSGISGGPNTSKYCEIIPILPFYRIYFDDGTFFDYDGDPESTKAQIKTLAPQDLEGYQRFHQDAKAIFERGFLELGYTHFGDMATMLKVVPDLVKLDAVRTLFSFAKKYFTSPKLQQVFSFETLLVGGNPLSVPAIYAMIHFVEKTWGIHYVRGGTNQLVAAMVRKFEELGGTMRYNSEVEQITVERKPAKTVTGVRLKDGTVLPSTIVVSNADYANTHLHLIKPEFRTWNADKVVKLRKQSMSLFVLYFGFKADGNEAQKLRHHNIILGPRYEGLLDDIFNKKVLAKDFSQYLHIPSLTEPSMAPEGHHTAYTLIPVPHNGSRLDWDLLAKPLADKVIGFLDDRGYLPNLRQRIVSQHHITPDYFEHDLNAYLGNAFGPEPILMQSAFFRPHNKSQDVGNLYLVGAGAQPGGGTPSVMMSAKMTARLVAQDFNIKM